LTGSTTFHNLSKVAGSADTLSLAAGSTQTITGLLTLRGASGRLLKLRSSSSGTPWALNLQGTSAVQFVDVQDSNGTGNTLTDRRGRDSGNNTNWKFV
jgi:hypothetical protein